MTPEIMFEKLGFVSHHGCWYLPTAVGKLPAHNVAVSGDIALIEIDGQLPSGRVAGGTIYVDLAEVVESGLFQVERLKTSIRINAMIGEMAPDVLRDLPQDRK